MRGTAEHGVGSDYIRKDNSANASTVDGECYKLREQECHSTINSSDGDRLPTRHPLGAPTPSRAAPQVQEGTRKRIGTRLSASAVRVRARVMMAAVVLRTTVRVPAERVPRVRVCEDGREDGRRGLHARGARGVLRRLMVVQIRRVGQRLVVARRCTRVKRGLHEARG